MNIFYLDHDPVICAQYHNDKHVVKMIVETCQLLSTAHRVLDADSVKTDLRDGILYKATHVNHPSAIWVRADGHNYRWLHNLLMALLDEYTFRYGKKHKCSTIAFYLASLPYNIPTKEFTPPPKCMPDECRVYDAVESYRRYYMAHKQHIAKWKNRDIPNWFKTTSEQSAPTELTSV